LTVFNDKTAIWVFPDTPLMIRPTPSKQGVHSPRLTPVDILRTLPETRLVVRQVFPGSMTGDSRVPPTVIAMITMGFHRMVLQAHLGSILPRTSRGQPPRRNGSSPVICSKRPRYDLPGTITHITKSRIRRSTRPSPIKGMTVELSSNSFLSGP
jgi:hypothetical protein